MKKLALSSLIAVFAVSGAHAANIIDGNPLYRPEANHFASVTDLSSATDGANAVTLGETLAYGITDRFAVEVSTSYDMADWFDENSWGDASVALNYRVFDGDVWKADIIGGYGVMPVWGDHESFLDKDNTLYAWTLGGKIGYTIDNLTFAGRAAFSYVNTESFNWNEDDDIYGVVPFGLNHWMNLGVDAQVVLTTRWNLVASADYIKALDHWNDTMGQWDLTFGTNYNIDATKFVGAYVTKTIVHDNNPEAGHWTVEDGFGFGAKFGIDF